MTLIYFAPVPWESYLQRPHYLVEHFLRRGGNNVVWIDPYPIRFPALKDLRQSWKSPSLFATHPPSLSVIKLRALPLEPLAGGRWLNRMLVWNGLARRLDQLGRGSRVVIGVGRPSSIALTALRTLDPAWSFYDAMDDFPEFYDGLTKRAVAECEDKIAKTVNAILTPSSALWDKFAHLPATRMMIHNASEMSLLPPATVNTGQPVFGFVGCISTWFDWPIVARLAETFPEARVEIVGPCYSGPAHALPPNVTLFPACPHPVAIDHLTRFSVGLIPFTRTRLTDGVDPIKFYEYRGMGLPVLTTTFGEMARRGVADGTYFMDAEGGLEPAASAALNRAPDPAAVDRFRSEHTWERRFEEARLFEHMTLR